MFPLPPLALQAAFAEQVQRIGDVARKLDAAATKAESVVAALSAEVFDPPLHRANDYAGSEARE